MAASRRHRFSRDSTPASGRSRLHLGRRVTSVVRHALCAITWAGADDREWATRCSSCCSAQLVASAAAIDHFGLWGAAQVRDHAAAGAAASRSWRWASTWRGNRMIAAAPARWPRSRGRWTRPIATAIRRSRCSTSAPPTRPERADHELNLRSGSASATEMKRRDTEIDRKTRPRAGLLRHAARCAARLADLSRQAVPAGQLRDARRLRRAADPWRLLPRTYARAYRATQCSD